jgi:tetratricopeptide (TPR) repeat protein
VDQRPDTSWARRVRRWLIGWLLGFACVAAFAQSAETPKPPPSPEQLTPKQRAEAQWQAGYLFHLSGQYERAIEHYRASVAIQPTAEAHTFLGWSLSHIGRIDEAIAQCKIAIEIDPDFGNPYNDIGVYLIDLGRTDEAIPWLRKAISARRYCCYQFPHYNLGRIFLAQGKIEEARRSFERALEYDPEYLPAIMGLLYIKQQGLKAL